MRGHDGIPERMPESPYSCYCLQKNMKIRMKRHYKIFCVNGKYGIQIMNQFMLIFENRIQI